MPTDNPKISLYVPQIIYDRFTEVAKEKGLSMSQAGTIILAEYFNLEETIKETTKGTIVGGVTLSRVEFLEDQVSKLLEMYKSLECKLENISLEKCIEKSPLAKIENKEKEVDKYKIENLEKSPIKESIGTLKADSNIQFSLLSEPLLEIAISGRKLSSLRFKQPIDTVATKKMKLSHQEFIDWTREQDPDGIAWIQKDKKTGYIPYGELSSELKDKLRQWIKENIN